MEVINDGIYTKHPAPAQTPGLLLLHLFLSSVQYMVVSSKAQGPVELNSTWSRDCPRKLLAELGTDLYSHHLLFSLHLAYFIQESLRTETSGPIEKENYICYLFSFILSFHQESVLLCFFAYFGT